MEKIEGHIVADATVKNFDSGGSVVNFTLADNDRIPDGKGGYQQLTRFFECSYWIGPAIAAHLTKGRPIVVEGRIGARAYISTQSGEAVAVLTIRVQRIKFLTSGHQPEAGQRSHLRVVTEEAPF